MKNAYQGLAESQDTIMKLFAEHNEEYALRVGVNRSATSYYHYTNTYRHLATFLKDKYHLSDMPVKQMDAHRQAVYAQDHTRTCKPPEKRDDACRVPWHYPV